MSKTDKRKYECFMANLETLDNEKKGIQALEFAEELLGCLRQNQVHNAIGMRILENYIEKRKNDIEKRTKNV